MKAVKYVYFRRVCASAALCVSSASLACSALVGCGAESESRKEQPAPAAGAPVANASVPTNTAPSDFPVEVVKLFSAMDSIGDGSDDAYKAELRSFLATRDPMGLIAQAYDKLPARAMGARWKAAYAAAQIQSAASVAFLERIALAPEEAVPATPAGVEVADHGFSTRQAAAIGVVHHYIAGVQGAKASLDRLLESADAGLAQIMGVELFGEGKLTDGQRSALNARGISTNFRKLTDAEFEDLRRINPEADRAPGAAKTTSETMPVPAMDGTE